MTDRLFFAFSLKAPWPEHFPEGKIIATKNRHVTLAFLGSREKDEILSLVDEMPKLSMGVVGKCDQLLFLPKKEIRVAAWHIDWIADDERITSYRKKLVEYLADHQLKIKDKALLSHVTMARRPKSKEEWKEAFEPIPCMIDALHLYKSLGNSDYESLWHSEMVLPFEEFEHTADIAFLIRGYDMTQLCIHAQIALAFAFPPFLQYVKIKEVKSVEEIVMHLNEMIFHADSEIGAPFKAVSFHGKEEKKENFYQWELIVDV